MKLTLIDVGAIRLHFKRRSEKPVYTTRNIIVEIKAELKESVWGSLPP